MARFIALPVGQGDAFYFDDDGWSVLVDGGLSRIGFSSMFQHVTRAEGVTVAVCTHNDADHANGIIGFLEAGFRCEEVWLPGRWLSALPDILKPFVEVYLELANNVSETPPRTVEQGSGRPPIETYADELYERVDQAQPSEDGPLVGEDGWPESYVHILEQAEPWQISAWPWPWPLQNCPWPDFPYRLHRRLGARGVQLLWSAIEAAGRIRTIAIEAFHRGIPVRWFQFDATTPSGGLDMLQPLNARAIARVQPVVGRLLDFLALTVSNKESLVFWSPVTAAHPGVLFTADSDLSGVSLPLQLPGSITTAPHHGSEANARAYAVVATATQRDAQSVTWVRSDGRYRGRPGRTYLDPSLHRLCTLCRVSPGVSSSKQTVHLFSRRGRWTRHHATGTCICR